MLIFDMNFSDNSKLRTIFNNNIFSSDVKMERSELGFQIEINLPESDSLRFCLKNENDEWDNNNGENYVFPIEHIETSLVVQDQDAFNLASPRKLRRSYIISKKIRLAIYKIIHYLPKFLNIC